MIFQLEVRKNWQIVKQLIAATRQEHSSSNHSELV